MNKFDKLYKSTIREGKEDAPNYHRVKTDATEKCTTCVHNQDGECMKYSFIFDKNYTCSEWATQTKMNESVDPYKAGDCPTCSLKASGTWRHIGAPVKCNNNHMWFRDTNVIANSPSDKLSNH